MVSIRIVPRASSARVRRRRNPSFVPSPRRTQTFRAPCRFCARRPRCKVIQVSRSFGRSSIASRASSSSRSRPPRLASHRPGRSVRRSQSLIRALAQTPDAKTADPSRPASARPAFARRRRRSRVHRRRRSRVPEALPRFTPAPHELVTRLPGHRGRLARRRRRRVAAPVPTTMTMLMMMTPMTLRGHRASSRIGRARDRRDSSDAHRSLVRRVCRRVSSTDRRRPRVWVRHVRAPMTCVTTCVTVCTLCMCKQYKPCTIPRVFPSMDEKLRKSCNSLTGWKTPEAFRAFWNWVNGGKRTGPQMPRCITSQKQVHPRRRRVMT